MSLTIPTKVRKLQDTLARKAKENPEFRFYSLFDKLHRVDVLHFAYRLCRGNGGAPGVDGVSFTDIAGDGHTVGGMLTAGEEAFLEELAQQLRDKTYVPQAVRRVYIRKPNGKQRPLGIPTIRDRVVQMAAVLILGPILEVDMPEEMYAYRPNRSALDAVRNVHRQIAGGRRPEIVDADLSGYFDTVPHAELMRSLARRISDGAMLKLIKMWLEAAIEETDDRGHKRRSTRNRDERRGTPQGAPISPLLANLYMRRFILGWKQHAEAPLNSCIVNYADDFVICCPQGRGQQAVATMKRLMRGLKLTVNEEKTALCHVQQESFDFLGYTFGVQYSPQRKRLYYGNRPAKEKVQDCCRRISELTSPRTLAFLDPAELITRLNRLLTGWANYFCLGATSKAYRAIDQHAARQVRRWLCRRHKIAGRGTMRFPDSYLEDTLELHRLCGRRRSFPHANTTST